MCGGVIFVNGQRFKSDMCWWRLIPDPYSKVKRERPVMLEGTIETWRQWCVALAMTTLM